MSDLRTRIAKALFRHGFEYLVWEDESDELRNVLLDEADAVIAELGLRKQEQTGEIVNIIEGDGINYSRHRYITEWTTDE